MYHNACPRCKGTVIADMIDQDYVCLQCGFRVSFYPSTTVDPTRCEGSGISIIEGSFRLASGKPRGRCSICGRMIQTKVGSFATISHSPTVLKSDREPNGVGGDRKRQFGASLTAPTKSPD